MDSIPIPIPPHLESYRSRACTEFHHGADQAGVPESLRADYFDAVFAIAAWLMQDAGTARTLGLGIAGAQGSGKSTLAGLLAQILDSAFGLPAFVLSLDDFYKTRETRIELARQVHPLLQVRGVPGTHDMALMNEAISNLKTGAEARVPIFNKAMDDRDGERRLNVRPRVLIVEGWCWGARPGSERDLETPVNRLEAEKDLNGNWRRYVNHCLASEDYQGAFRSMDRLIYLAVPDMEAVYRWRLQQERAIAGGGDHVMDEVQVREFIMYYERITRRMLADLPERADISLYLDNSHAIESVKLRAADG